jgi:ribose transport system ATP-binding protein
MSSQPIHGSELSPDRSAQPSGTLISMRGIEKRFGPVLALRGVDFDLRAGEVHGLLGQNGAGKTTLIKIMAGIEMPTAGEFRIAGQPVHLAGVADSKARGISVVHQSLSLVPTLTVADNMYLGSEARRAGVLLDRRRMNEESARLLSHYGIPLRPTQVVGTLPFAYRQLLEIAKALALESKVLILDEPTSSLTKAEEPILFGAIREVTRKGIGVVYVSHRLSEIMDLTDRVTVFRDGSNVGECKTSETSIPELVEAIVGRSVETFDESWSAVSRRSVSDEEVVLELDDVRSNRVHGASLTLRRGEVLGLVGTTGSGRTEILETVFGVRPLKSGGLKLHGEAFLPKSAGDAIEKGIKLVPEDRHKWGLVLEHDIEHNIAMSNLRVLTRWHALFRNERSRQDAEGIRDHLNVKAQSIDVRVDRLSGGNQQKVVIGKWLVGDTDVLLLDEPTAGVDVGARADIYRIILRLAASGTAVLVSSSDYSELIQICSTFAFVTNGQISGAVDRSEVSDEKQLHQMLEETRRGDSHDH